MQKILISTAHLNATRSTSFSPSVGFKEQHDEHTASQDRPELFLTNKRPGSERLHLVLVTSFEARDCAGVNFFSDVMMEPCPIGQHGGGGAYELWPSGCLGFTAGSSHVGHLYVQSVM